MLVIRYNEGSQSEGDHLVRAAHTTVLYDTREREPRRHFGANQSGGTQHHAISIVQEPWHDKEPLHCTAGSGTLARARTSRPKADRADRDLRRQQDSGDLCRTRETKEEEEGAATLPQPGSRREHLRELFEENRRASWEVGPTCMVAEPSCSERGDGQK